MGAAAQKVIAFYTQQAATLHPPFMVVLYLQAQKSLFIEAYLGTPRFLDPYSFGQLNSVNRLLRGFYSEVRKVAASDGHFCGAARPAFVSALDDVIPAILARSSSGASSS